MSAIVPTVINIVNNHIYHDGPIISFFGLPNILIVKDNNGLNAPTTQSFYFDSSLTVADFAEFAKVGEVFIQNNYYLSFSVDTHDTNNYIGQLMMQCKATLSGSYPRNTIERLKISNILGSHAMYGGSWTGTSTCPNAASADEYGLSSGVFTATADEQYFTQSHTTALDPTVLTGFKVYTAIMIIEGNTITREQEIILDVGGTRQRFKLNPDGKNIICFPFIYLNNTGVADPDLDYIGYQVYHMNNTDSIRMGRISLVEGLINYNNDVIVTTNTAAPGATTSGLTSNIGYVRGDISYRNNVATGGFIGDVNTVQGNPGTWKSFGVVS